MMIRKLIPTYQTAPLLPKCIHVFRKKNFCRLFQTSRISNQFIISLKIDQKFMRQLSFIQYLMIFRVLVLTYSHNSLFYFRDKINIKTIYPLLK